MTDYRPTSLTTRIEQALAFGRSVDWMTKHLGATDHDIDMAVRRMDAAVADDEPTYLAITRPPVPIDENEARVLAYMQGDLAGQAPTFQLDPNRVEAIRRLAAEGCTDAEIGSLLGSSKDAVTKMRNRNGIECGASVVRSREPSWAALTRAEPRARRVQRDRGAVA